MLTTRTSRRHHRQASGSAVILAVVVAVTGWSAPAGAAPKRLPPPSEFFSSGSGGASQPSGPAQTARATKERFDASPAPVRAQQQPCVPLLDQAISVEAQMNNDVAAGKSNTTPFQQENRQRTDLLNEFGTCVRAGASTALKGGVSIDEHQPGTGNLDVPPPTPLTGALTTVFSAPTALAREKHGSGRFNNGVGGSQDIGFTLPIGTPYGNDRFTDYLGDPKGLHPYFNRFQGDLQRANDGTDWFRPTQGLNFRNTWEPIVGPWMPLR